MELIDKIMKYEDGAMDNNEIVEFFSELVKSGDAWTLQGAYGRMAHQLIKEGYLDARGNIQDYPY